MAASLAETSGKVHKAVRNTPIEDARERRRVQVRLAQRAHRNRHQETIKELDSRIAHLETIMENLSSNVLSFSDQLLQSGVLESYPNLTVNLRDTIKTIVSLASEASHATDEPLPTQDSSASPFPGAKTRSLLHNAPSAPSGHTRPHNLTDAGFTPAPTAPAISSIEIPDFIEQLSLEALKQSYMALCDPSIGMDQLRRPFGLILSTLSREDLVSYVKADLDAQLSRKELEGWESVPFFQLGGAGTHHLGPSSLQGQNARLASHRHRRCRRVKDPLSLLTPDSIQALEGEWFDLHDLEGFLRETDVLLLLRTDGTMRVGLTKPIVHVTGFIRELIRRGVCLGRSPGFQRGDVEKALQASTIL
ncbi:hypothetical protein BJY04DRAFT_194029 [Aspergillus karnatakaensis]|uniref:bZIP transcription factor n=1 Tax=Aspergillus karnatakaensis TaxID=1810916 RepID=UPI003CCD8C60